MWMRSYKLRTSVDRNKSEYKVANYAQPCNSSSSALIFYITILISIHQSKKPLLLILFKPGNSMRNFGHQVTWSIGNTMTSLRNFYQYCGYFSEF